MVLHCIRQALALLVLAACLTTTVFAADLITVDQPTSNEQLASNTVTTLQYTVIGAQSAGITNAYYPSSLNVDFQWTQKGSESNVLSFNLFSSLTVDPNPAGIGNKQYSQTWKTPNCHFFSRYQTSSYSFALVFTPVYQALSPNQTAPGPQMSAFSVPISFQVNNGSFPKC